MPSHHHPHLGYNYKQVHGLPVSSCVAQPHNRALMPSPIHTHLEYDENECVHVSPSKPLALTCTHSFSSFKVGMNEACKTTIHTHAITVFFCACVCVVGMHDSPPSRMLISWDEDEHMHVRCGHVPQLTRMCSSSTHELGMDEGEILL